MLTIAEVVIFDDQFENQKLGSDWVINSGRGNYSLTDKLGYLRYIIDANHTARIAGSGQNYAKSLWLVRSFSGDRWILKTAITYNMRPGQPTNCRNMHFWVRTPGEDWNFTTIAYIGRSVGVNDDNPGSNSMGLYAGRNGAPIYFPNSPNPLPLERWYFEIERNKDRITVRASAGGDDSTFKYEREYTFPTGLGNDQVIEINGDGWYGSNDPPGYADFDFIKVVKVVVNPGDLSVKVVEGVGEVYEPKLEAQGVKTIGDMALVDVFALNKKTGLPLTTLYVWKRRAALAMDVKIDKMLFSNILKMSLGDIIVMSNEELSQKANQPADVISNLKNDISTLLVSLDNAAVESMTLESVATSR